MNVRQKDEHRLRVLKALYDLSEGSPGSPVRVDEIAEHAGLTVGETEAAAEYLKEKYLVERFTWGSYHLTSSGVDEIEEAERHPNDPTDFLPAMVTLNIGNMNVAHVGSMTGSTLQQGGHGSHQSATTNYGDVTSFLNALKKELPNLGLSEPERSDINANVEMIESQLKQTPPKSAWIKASLTSIKNVLVTFAGEVAVSMAASAAAEKLPALIASAQQAIASLPPIPLG